MTAFHDQIPDALCGIYFCKNVYKTKTEHLFYNTSGSDHEEENTDVAQHDRDPEDELFEDAPVDENSTDKIFEEVDNFHYEVDGEDSN